MESDSSKPVYVIGRWDTIRALKYVFWGAILIVVDFNVACNSEGRQTGTDLMPDVIGWILVSIGVFSLAKEDAPKSYSDRMWFVKFASLLAIFNSVFPWSRFPLLKGVDVFIGLLILVGVGMFFDAMVSLSRIHELKESQKSWSHTYIAAGLVYVLPLALLYLGKLTSMFVTIPFIRRTLYQTQNPMYVSLMLLITFVFLLPLVFVFISTNTMKREIENRIYHGELSPDIT